jgi:hypothetical protein
MHMNRGRAIDGIFNYCTRRCELCPFTEQCTLYQSEREYEQRHPGRDAGEHVNGSFNETMRLLEAWCEREGIDFKDICRESAEDESLAEAERAGEALRSDPLHQLATAYSRATFEIIDALATARVTRHWPSEVEAAIETITWHAGMVGAKVHRALSGLAERCEATTEDPVQNDWNGSAKVARIVVDESRRAWQVMLREGEAPPDSNLVELVALLDRIDRGLAERFPRAMEFVRPGFDEPLAGVDPV